MSGKLSPLDRARMDRTMAELERETRQPEMDADRIVTLTRDAMRIAMRAVGKTDDEIDAEFARTDAELEAHRNDSIEDFLAWADAQ